jgi:hypothetical protein
VSWEEYKVTNCVGQVEVKTGGPYQKAGVKNPKQTSNRFPNSQEWYSILAVDSMLVTSTFKSIFINIMKMSL